ncbi:hypothetical protein NA647_00950 [Pseudomonas stutzeri]|uniref:hypothetical protein n=1 Tax=Stutzerimonas stutzeri TaxID=316 RepID=UPI00210C5851|nr:hypothetical protein [Stutzerimonas stutzeri]MCQ4286003.1 hypothetical protein [Stutzerimonas stutzeri]
MANHPEGDFVNFYPAAAVRTLDGRQQHAAAVLIIEQDVMAPGRAPEQSSQQRHVGL